MPRKIDYAVLVLTETAIPYALILFAGALDLLTTYIGLSRGLIEGDGYYIPLMANLIYCGLAYALSSLFQHLHTSYAQAIHALCIGVLVFSAFYPVVNNLFFILFS